MALAGLGEEITMTLGGYWVMLCIAFVLGVRVLFCSCTPLILQKCYWLQSCAVNLGAIGHFEMRS